MKTRLSNWREESDLYEVVTGKMTDKEALKKVDEKKGIKNKVIINPSLKEAIEDIGGEVISVNEALAPSKQELNIMKKLNRLQLRLQKEKKKTTQKADQVAKAKEKEDDIPVQQEEFEAAVEYFYEQGINEEGIDLIIEEVGLEDFVDFVDFIHDETIFLNEERKARKMNVRTLKATKKKAEEIKADKSDVVKRGTPADTLARARTERSLKKPKLAKPAAKKEAPTPVKKAAVAVKKARKATVKKARKDFDGDGRVETPKSEHRGVRNKKITKAVAKAKPVQSKKPASKEGLRAKIKSAYDAGVKRHRKATQGVRVFHKGMKAGAKKAVKFAKDVKKVVSEEELLERNEIDIANRKWLEKRQKKIEQKHKEGKPVKPMQDYGKISEEELKERLGGKGYKSYTSLTGKKVSGDWEDSDRGAGNKAKRRSGGEVKAKSPTYLAHVHNKKIKEDKALELVKAAIIKKHGKGAIYDGKSKPPSEAEKKKAAAERKKRQEADNKAFAARAKKAGYKNPQDYANVVARYGSEDNYKKGRGLGT